MRLKRKNNKACMENLLFVLFGESAVADATFAGLLKLNICLHVFMKNNKITITANLRHYKDFWNICLVITALFGLTG